MFKTWKQYARARARRYGMADKNATAFEINRIYESIRHSLTVAKQAIRN